MVSEFINVTSRPELSPGVEFKIWARSSFRDQTAYVFFDNVNKFYLSVSFGEIVSLKI